MKKMILAIAALAFVAWGCSSDSNDDVRPDIPAVIPVGIQEGTDARPNWTATNYDLYEQLMIIDVLIQDTLQQYASEQDLLCATIKGEVRGVASAYQTDDNQWLFSSLTVGSNEAGVMVQLSYYCDKLHRIFTITNWALFDASVAPTGTDGIYKPLFIK